MQSRCWWTAPALVACLAVGMLLGAEDERGHERRHDTGDAGDLETKIHHALPRIINEGADLYNCGRPVDCYELWRGALLAFLPLLDHHHHLQRTIDETLHRAAHMKNPCEAAFTLRAAIDELRRETAHRPEPKRPMPPAAKEQPKEKVEKKEPPAPPKPLWDRLGGARGVTAVATTFLNLLQNDARIHFLRAKDGQRLNEKQLGDLKEQIIDFISSRTGGPLEYTGKPLKDVFLGKGATNAEFDAAADDFRKALQIQGIASDDNKLLMSTVESMRGDVVQPAAESPAKSSEKTETPAKSASRWERLGGKKAVTDLVEDIMEAAAKDGDVRFLRGPKPKNKPNPETVEQLKTQLVEQISAWTGGPLKPKGKGLEKTLKGLNVTKAGFDAFLHHVRKVLDKHDVDEKDARFLLKQFDELREEVLEKETAFQREEQPEGE